MRTRELIVIGAGGHAKVVIEVARAAGWTPVACFDPDPVAPVVLGVPVRGGDAEARAMIASGDARAAIVALGANALRLRIGDRLRGLGCETPSLVHPRATISPSATLGPGTVVMAGAVVNADAVIGRDVIVNTLAAVEHDCVLEDGCHVGPRSALGGGCHVGRRTLFGLGACARPLVRIGDDVVVGVGSVVVGDVASGLVVYGTPARAGQAAGSD